MDHAKSALSSLKNAEEKYDVLYVNTPWSAMTVERMGNLPLRDICADNAALFMWTDSFTAPKTSELLEKWGFKFHSVFQIMDIAQYPWMKKPITTALATAVKASSTKPSDTKQSDTAEKENTTQAKVVDDNKDEENKENVDPKKVTQKKTVKKTRAPTVNPPSWWSPAPEEFSPSRPSTEQLWLAIKGDPASVFGSSSVAYNVVNMPELGKKSRSKKGTESWKGNDQRWDLDRPLCFLETVVQHTSSGAKVLDLFSTTLHDKVDSWGPGLPGGYLRGFAKNTGLVHEVNKVMRTMKKTHLQCLSQKIPKMLAASDKKTFLTELEESWAPVAQTLENLKLPMSYNWKKDDGEIEEWAYHVVQILAQKNVAVFSSIRKKRKKRQGTAKPGNRPRHGIACPSKVSKEMAEFLKLDPNELIARTAVVKKLNDYIRENSLKNPDRQVEILLDEPLKKLLAPPEDFGTVTYFNLCKLVGAHFPKKTEEEKKADKRAREEEKKASKARLAKEANQEAKKAKV